MATRRPQSRAERDDAHAAAREAADARNNKIMAEACADIIELMQSGQPLPWHKPWKDTRGDHVLQPKNATTGVRYSGGNRMILAVRLMRDHFVEGQPFDNRWLTKMQAEDLGGSLKADDERQGVRLVKIVKGGYTKEVAGENGQIEEQQRQYTAPRLFVVHHVSRFEGLQLPEPEPLPVVVPRDPTMQLSGEGQDILDAFLKKTKLTLRHGNDIDVADAASYRFDTDTVTMPRLMLFDTDEDYYDTLFHELGHSTMHESRMNRKGALAPFGSEAYAKEELRADFTSAFLGAIVKLPASDRRIKDHAAYLKDWARKLKPQDIFTEARAAEKITDWIVDLGRSHRLEIDQALSAAQALDPTRSLLGALPTVPLLPAPASLEGAAIEGASMARRAPPAIRDDLFGGGLTAEASGFAR